MNLHFVIRHALRESRSSWKRLALYMSSITLGVAALVAINSFRTNAIDSVTLQSRALLGADVRLTSSRPFDAPMEALLDSVGAKYEVARVTSLVSMGLAPRTSGVRLLQIRAVETGYPYYGDIVTEPAGVWQQLQQRGTAIVEEPVLTYLDLGVGDTLRLGEAAFTITGALKKAPIEFGFRNVIAPRVYIAAADLPATGLLQFGSLAQFQAYVRIPDEKQAGAYVKARRDLFKRNQVNAATAEEQENLVTAALNTMSRFLGLVGLAALLLGGIGVATAVHVFIKDKRSVVAVLRCLGARQRTVFAAYLLQASLLSFLGASLGVVIGFLVQGILPRVMSAMVPFEVPFTIDWASVAAGVGVGLLVAVLFAIVPLLTIRTSSPLQALRVDYEPPRRRFDWYKLLALGALAIGIAGLSVWQAHYVRTGLAFAGALAVTLLMLWLVAWLLTRVARRAVPRRARFPVRQGVANLYRPQNQTVSVTLSLGFGVFVIATMIAVQSNLLAWLDVESLADAPNVMAFDIQADQIESLQSTLDEFRATNVTMTPIVPSRIAALNGKSVDSLLAASRQNKIPGWALRREYRNTYRDTMVTSEVLVSGKWFNQANRRNNGIVPISIEQDVANDLKLKLGDRVTWDVQGTEIETQVTSIRKVDWARFATNFFVVFPSGVLEKAPQTYVAVGRVTQPGDRVALQRAIVRENSNVSIIDLATVREALDEVIGRITLAIRFMALFSIAAGLIVLIGAVATSRFQRLRESALLKTIGAGRRQIMEVLVTEYASLGVLAGATGVLFGGVASWLLMKFFFKLQYQVPVLALIGLWVGVTGVAVLVGLVSSRDVFRRSPLAVLREV